MSRRLRGLFTVAAAIVACASLVACVAPYNARGVSRARVGLNGAALGPNDRMDKELALIDATGATWLRADFNWPTLEPQRGKYNWAPADHLVTKARAAGLSLMGIITYAPGWAGSPPNVNDFAAFAGQLAARYSKLGVHAWEIWNEANLKGPWPGNVDPVRYTAMLKAAYRTIHAADSKAVVVSSGLSSAIDDPSGYSLSPQTFLKRMYQAGAKGSFDAVGLHLSITPNPVTAAGDWNPTNAATKFMYPTMQANGDGHKKIWATEAGYSTATASGKGVSESQQWPLLQLMTETWLNKSFAGPIFLYTLRDPGTDNANMWAKMGILRNDYSHKPAYDSMRAWMHGK
jgi:hypothetical protein